MSVTTYWCQIFLLPKKVIKQVNSVCKAFLWHYNENDPRLGNVIWDALCRPKKEGGLTIRNLKFWNLSAIRKIAWHISSLQESLWVRWVYGVYTKGGNWLIFNPPITASWAFKKLC